MSPTITKQAESPATVLKRKGYVTPAEAAKTLGIPRQTIYTWIASGFIPASELVRSGPRRIYVRLQAVRAATGLVA